ncbi:cationic amino acid transporter KNAG_0K00800 [Huiozyma naganishii CBS 8797]|uniref:Uncharacterized protein n=1 Tax=Huiozyma naganishii (strain ATCC MYA-139 / BCRC 22969 / CBS 8797 / KCTC 17520 / NBRC 10181 / NCYC 3082 / Yp74L-3) TaxID=1071383 RepID=J7SAS5_HUIN7|nr:hypothetical protein KNAG_0K00800 [Kazachstania naganishii CBS 8797]CCK72446.1 hypothetical protein KNAG_0K00800 [Kazachstania naganishii CBS 8797]
MRFAPIEFTGQNVSGLMGSISIACWVIVFVPQIYENFYRKSSSGLSLLFVVLWLAGDVFNLLGALLQHLLSTMIILAAYYTVADIILLGQCLWYDNGEEDVVEIDPVHFSPANPVNENVLQDVFHEHEPLLRVTKSHRNSDVVTNEYRSIEDEINRSMDADANNDSEVEVVQETLDSGNYTSDIVIVSTVIMAGFIAWYIPYCRNYNPTPLKPKPTPTDVEFNWLAQLFGYLSAVLYLGSRIPQILLNFKRKSCEGISFLFFLFACLGNTTFITSVLCVSLEPKYLLVNASWLVGSSGTLVMDFIIFGQFFAYGRGKIVSSPASV